MSNIIYRITYNICLPTSCPPPNARARPRRNGARTAWPIIHIIISLLPLLLLSSLSSLLYLRATLPQGSLAEYCGLLFERVIFVLIQRVIQQLGLVNSTSCVFTLT